MTTKFNLYVKFFWDSSKRTSLSSQYDNVQTFANTNANAENASNVSMWRFGIRIQTKENFPTSQVKEKGCVKFVIKATLKASLLWTQAVTSTVLIRSKVKINCSITSLLAFC